MPGDIKMSALLHFAQNIGQTRLGLQSPYLFNFHRLPIWSDWSELSNSQRPRLCFWNHFLRRTSATLSASWAAPNAFSASWYRVLSGLSSGFCLYAVVRRNKSPRWALEISAPP